LHCGDAFGERFFVPGELAPSLIDQRAIPAAPWFFTDDTLMAASIVSNLEEHKRVDQDSLAMSFAQNYDSTRGYGPAMHGLLKRIAQKKGSWKEEAQALFEGQGSFGNGSAMRVAPLGAYFADDLEMTVEQAEMSAVTTHWHEEAVAGAVAVALATALACRYRNASQKPEITEFLRQVYERVPTSQVRRGLQKALDLRSDTPVSIAASVLGNGSLVTAQDTVPFALWSAACHLDSYQEALWATVSGLGDRDTTCAIVGGVVVMRTGVQDIPREWMTYREAIPRALLANYELLTNS
jgi:ADP-ribosylglycohydrolase